MANVGKYAIFDNDIIETKEANVSITSSAVLYGLSVYSVFYGHLIEDDKFLLFRLEDHLHRLRQSAKLIGFTVPDDTIYTASLLTQLRELIAKNKPTTNQFFRVTLHAVEEVPGVRTRDLKLSLSLFMYDAVNILPQDQARIKTSLWRRTADTAIPARAKVNGAYVNSALAKQDALDAGFDDCLFLNQHGYVSELSAANVFLVKNGTLITPDSSSDILEGITRRSIIELAKEAGIQVIERKVALTELYTAEEAFACGTSAFVAPIINLDGRTIGTGKAGKTTKNLKDKLQRIQTTPNNHNQKI